ncbi:unnamed protein product [Paramecium primaurelia]|uniref:Uncharacterized protein n=1 Tax=Paramecium primaurelia TaxID=5886 RepID=A0A8S1NHY9_PARPR|nr:unnamed protein product [Paramecium primaurelia]
MKKRAQQRVLSKFGQFINDNPDVELRILLDQEELLDSKQNIKLFGEFVTKSPERFWEMLQIINLKQKDNEEVIPNKYPFIVSEIIGSKEDQIINYFFDQQGPEEFEFLNLLFKTIDRDYIDNTLAGYMAKILKAIIEKKGLSLWKYLINPQKESQYILKDLIKHLDVLHIADIIFNLIRMDTIREEGAEAYLNQRLQLLLRIIDYMQQKHDNVMIVENVSYILQNILTETIENEERIQFIYYILNSTLNFDSIVVSKSSKLIKIMIIILETIERDNQNGRNNIAYNYSLLQNIAYNLVNLLNLEIYLTPFQTSYGIYQEPLGQFKLQLIEFYLIVLKQNEQNIMPQFSHSNICYQIMQLILKHEFNNAIQNLFVEIISLVMKNNEYNQIKEDYIKANIYGFLIYLNQQQKYQVGSIKKFITKGFQGMANKLSFLLKDDFQEENWNFYIQNQKDIFNIENTYLFGFNPNYVEDAYKEEELIQSIKFTNDQINDTKILQFGKIEQQNTEVIQRDVQQPIEQQNTEVIQRDVQQTIEQQLPQKETQQSIIIMEQKSEVQITQTNNSEQLSNLVFGQIDINNNVAQVESVNPNDEINQSIQIDEEPNNITAEIQKVLKNNKYQDPDYPDRVVNDFYKAKAMNEKNINSGNLDQELIQNRPRRGTVSSIFDTKRPILKRKSSHQTFETDKQIPNRLSVSGIDYKTQTFSPLLQNQQEKNNNKLK